MDLGLAGKVALVTGGGSGIGAAIGLALATEGCDVAIVDRAAGEPPVAASIRALGRTALVRQADVRDRAAASLVVAETVGALGRLDILVCCAGITDDATVWKMRDHQWDDVLAVNLTGCFTYVRAVAALFRQQQSGRIVNIASINGLRGKFGQANYAASKGGLIALSKSVARELGKYHVTVNVIAPGMVMTEMARSLPADVVETAVHETVLGDLATPGDCADAVTFLCSERARHITGAVIRIDAGQYI